MKIRNIKASIILKKPHVDHTLNSTHTIFKVKCKNSFITLTLYRKKPHFLNATGIKNFRILKLFLSQIKEFYVSHKIDTVFYIQKTKKKHNLNYLTQILTKNFKDLYMVDFNSELFSGIILKPHDKKFPTIIMHSQSYIMLSRRFIFYVMVVKKRLDKLLSV